MTRKKLIQLVQLCMLFYNDMDVEDVLERLGHADDENVLSFFDYVDFVARGCRYAVLTLPTADSRPQLYVRADYNNRLEDMVIAMLSDTYGEDF